MSGLCYSDTRTCGAPRPDGEPCGTGAECASRLCLAAGTCGEPAPDGSPCGAPEECIAGSCLSDGTCGAPRAMGGACNDDADCETRNCSTNGREGAAGVCFQMLGSICTNGSTTCDRCLGADFLSDGYCSRGGCDPADAPNCPRFRDHEFECDRGTDGSYYCYELCLRDPDTGETEDHRCYDRGSCFHGGTYCR